MSASGKSAAKSSPDLEIRLGIIGAGNIVKTRHLPGLKAQEACRVLAVHNRRRANAEAVAKEWGIGKVTDSAQDILSNPEINAVLIGTTPYLHRDLSVAALNAGKHVFCQARMSRTLAEARDMLAAAQAHPKQVSMLCPAPHIFPGRALLERLLREGAIGELRLVRLQHLSGGAASPDVPFHWRMDKAISGHQVMTLGIYSEILNRMVGRARTVSAFGKVFTHRRKDPETGEMKQVDIPETLSVTGELVNGAHYVLTFSSVAPGSPGDMIELYGTEGCLWYDVVNHHVYRGGPDPAPTRVGRVQPKQAPQLVEIPAAERCEWRVEQEFVSAIRYGTPVFPNFQDGVDYMEFVEAVARSMEQGKQITLPLG